MYTQPRPKIISKENWSAKRTMVSYLKNKIKYIFRYETIVLFTLHFSLLIFFSLCGVVDLSETENFDLFAYFFYTIHLSGRLVFKMVALVLKL